MVSSLQQVGGGGGEKQQQEGGGGGEQQQQVGGGGGEQQQQVVGVKRDSRVYSYLIESLNSIPPSPRFRIASDAA